MDERNRQAVGNQKSKAVKREVCEILSIGTISRPSNPEARFILALYCDEFDRNSFGYSFCDVNTSRIWLGEWKFQGRHLLNPSGKQVDSSQMPMSSFRSSEDLSMEALRTLLHQIIPVEVIIASSNLPSQMMKALKLVRLLLALVLIRFSDSKD